MPSRSLAYSTSTDHAAPNVTLKVKIVIASVRIGGCSTSQRIPSAISARRPGRSGSTVLALVTTRDTRSAPRTKQAAFVANGRAMPAAKRNAPIGGATSWFVSTKAPCIRALAMPRSSRATRPGSRVLLAESANVSAVPRTNSATSTTRMFTFPLTIVATSTPRTTARPRFTTMTMRRRSNRSAAAPPNTPNSSTGRYSAKRAIDTSSGSCVWEATSSGPAASAMPSPTLLMVVADRSQRKLRPSLAGVTVSVIRASSVRTGGRIPTDLGQTMVRRTEPRESVPTQLNEAVAHEQEPNRGENGSDDDDDAQRRDE